MAEEAGPAVAVAMAAAEDVRAADLRWGLPRVPARALYWWSVMWGAGAAGYLARESDSAGRGR